MSLFQNQLNIQPPSLLKVLFFSWSSFLMLIPVVVSGFIIQEKPDSLLLKGYLDTMQTTYFRNHDSSLLYAKCALELANKIGDTGAQIRALNTSGEQNRFMGEFPKALELQFEALRLNIAKKDSYGEAYTRALIGWTYIEMGDYREGLNLLMRARPVLETTDPLFYCFANSHIGFSYMMLDNLDSAFFYLLQAYNYKDLDKNPPLHSLVLERLGTLHEKVGQQEVAEEWYRKGIFVARRANVEVNLSRLFQDLSQLKAKKDELDSAIFYSRMAWQKSQYDKQKLRKLKAAKFMATLFENSGNSDSAYYYQSIAFSLQDSVYGAEQYRKLQLLLLDEQKHVQTLERNRRVQRNRLIFSIIGIIMISLIIFIWTLRRNSHKEKLANRLLQQQKEKLQKTLVELQTMQNQLIHAEKMASLGELTAGIAHEIQNPLNFVNNFAEVSNEMLAELKEELDRNNPDEVKAIANDVTENLQKIHHHGRRASDIVKSMLQHSRTGSGKMEPVDLNKLADEYLRLAYHGFRAKDKSFNANFKMDLDPSLPNINVVGQDIGRVLLNLINNAFYAVSEKSKRGVEGYEPTVIVRTKRINHSVEIRVKDNGNGIPANVINKIFQPFFTTKPTGEGTGLGLSLSYDIITKGHGGSLEVDTTEGVGTEFIIQLPVV